MPGVVTIPLTVSMGSLIAVSGSVPEFYPEGLLPRVILIQTILNWVPL